MKIFLLTSRLLNEDGGFSIGGIQTYIRQFASSFGNKYEVVVCQPSTREFEKNIENYLVKGIGAPYFKSNDRRITSYLQDSDLLIISTEQLNVTFRHSRQLVIQHGVYWDLPVKLYTKNKVANYFPRLFKLYDNYRNFKRIKKYKNLVCVDYAYPNWMRTVWNDEPGMRNYFIIPNHARDEFFSTYEINRSETLKILFARRFIPMRGGRQFCVAASRLLEKNSNLEVALYGTGPELEKMQSILPPNKQTRYAVIDYELMPNVVKESDIIVVPSLGSEGTSLSAIEGMAAGKAVIATSVGGLKDLIIDGYSGLLVSPGNEEELYKAMLKLANDNNLRKHVGKNAKKIAMANCSQIIWEKKWTKVLRLMECYE